MDLKAAKATIQNAANVFKALKDVAEAADVVLGQEQFLKEREAAIMDANKRLNDATEAHTIFMVHFEQAKAKAADALKALNDRHDKALARFAEEEAAAEAAKTAAVAVARTKQAEAEHECQQAIDFLEGRKAELEGQVGKLEKALASLKSKVGAL